MTSTPVDSGSNILAYIGSTIFLIAASIGGLILTPQLQMSMSMKTPPHEMTLQEFVDNGPPVGNAHIRLTGVLADFENSIEILEVRQRRYTSSERSNVFVELYPMGCNPAVEEPAVVLQIGTSDTLEEELLAQGTLTGKVTSLKHGHSAKKFTSGRHNFLNPSLRWVVEPAGSIPDFKETRQYLLLCLVVGSLGLVVSSMAQSTQSGLAIVISWFGGPLRSKSVGLHWIFIYLAGGIGLAYYGYDLGINSGNLGKVLHNPTAQLCGFLATQIGLSLFLAPILVPITFRIFADADSQPAMVLDESRSTTDSIDLEQPKKPQGSKLLKPMEVTIYEDPAFYRGAKNEAPFQRNPKLAEELGASLVACLRVEETMPIGRTYEFQAFLCCEGIVQAEQSDLAGKLRLVSMLTDGMVVMTAYPEPGLFANMMTGSTCSLVIMQESASVFDMVQEHLRRVKAIATPRGAKEVRLETADCLDLCLYSRRALAELYLQYGRSELDVHPDVYGRFHYPLGTRNTKPLASQAEPLQST
jgi:hypothetical protein